MPQLAPPCLTPDQLSQLVVSYVLHLSIRGETEYEVMKKAADPEANEMTRARTCGNRLFRTGRLGCAQCGSFPVTIPSFPIPIPTRRPMNSSIQRRVGMRLFNSPDLACATCHVDYGREGHVCFRFLGIHHSIAWT